MFTDFQNSVTDRLSDKFATNSYLNIPPHLKHVATLPCEIWMSENWRQSETYIVIRDKSSCSSCDGILHYKFITQFAGEIITRRGLCAVAQYAVLEVNGWERPIFAPPPLRNPLTNFDVISNIILRPPRELMCKIWLIGSAHA